MGLQNTYGSKQAGVFHQSKLKAGKHIKSHSHAGDILNFIMEGSITINSKTYNKGDWYLTTKGTTYSGVVNEDSKMLMFCTLVSTQEGGHHVEAWVHHE